MGASAVRKEARARRFGKHEPFAKHSAGTNPVLGAGNCDDSNAEEESHTNATDEATMQAGLNSGKQQRFIVFIGNLPFTATNNSIRRHFAKVQPQSIRHSTDKETGKSKGFAFLEFEGYDRMKTCLKLYHHSSFDDGETPARKLNVELTAGGGGGKSRDRKYKLRQKNTKLNEERRRRTAEAAKQAKKTPSSEHSAKPEPAQSDVHPSRMSRVPMS